jgi:hypothetical protein
MAPIDTLQVGFCFLKKSYNIDFFDVFYKIRAQFTRMTAERQYSCNP